MTIAFVGSTTASGPYTSDATATLPGVGADDVQFAWLDCGENNTRAVSGWTLVKNVQVGSGSSTWHHAALYWRRGPGTFTAPRPATGSYGPWVLAIVAYSGLVHSGIPYQSASIIPFSGFPPAAPSAPVNSATRALRVWAAAGSRCTSTGTTERVTSFTDGRDVVTIGDDAVAPPTAAEKAAVSYSGGYWITGTVVLDPYTNTPPNAPTLTRPPNDTTLDRGVPNVFALDASDPDAGDSTSQTYWRTRIRDIGAAWETVTRISPVTTYEFAADYFAAGKYEWQAATRDSFGEPADEADLVWSTSSFFTAAEAPPAPIFTAPVNGAVIGLSSFEAVISAPDLVASEWRTVADDGSGNADPTTIYSPSVVVTEAPGVDARRHVFEFPVNNRTEHLQSRIKNAEGLWSQWADSRNPISYTPPADPIVTLSTDNENGALIVTITNPAPGSGEPAASFNSVRIDDGDGKGLTHRIGSQMLALNTPYTYRLAVIGRDYTGHVEVTTTADNGTTSTTTG